MLTCIETDIKAYVGKLSQAGRFAMRGFPGTTVSGTTNRPRRFLQFQRNIPVYQ